MQAFIYNLVLSINVLRSITIIVAPFLANEVQKIAPKRRSSTKQLNVKTDCLTRVGRETSHLHGGGEAVGPGLGLFGYFFRACPLHLRHPHLKNRAIANGVTCLPLVFEFTVID